MTVAIPGRTEVPDPGGAAPTTAAPGVAIADGVASPVLASPTSAEVSGDEIRALLKPSDANGLDRGDGTGVAVVFDPATEGPMSVGASGVVGAYANGVQVGASSFEPKYHTTYAAALSAPTSGGTVIALASGVQVGASSVEPVLGDATEVVGGEVVPILGDATEISGGEVVPVLGDQAMTTDTGEVVIDRSWRTVDLSAPASYHNQGAVITSVVSAGGGAYTFTRAAIASILDGPSDGMEAYRFPLLDSAGNTVDYASGKYLVEWEITLTSVTAGGSSLVMAGVKTQPTSYTAGVVRVCGFSTDTAANDLSVCTALGSNGTTAKASLAKVTGTLVPTLIGSGPFDIGTLTAVSLDGSGARIGTPNDSTTASDATPGTCNEIAVWFGGDAVDASTRSFTIIFKYRVVQIRP